MSNISNDRLEVVVWMVTYNHEHYIAQAIESVLNQQTTFSYKLIIGEDCSTDKTREICISYAEKYPDKIQLLLQKHNVGAIVNGHAIYKASFDSGASFIAMLEGDDYWADSLKLQKQVDFFKNNAECVYLFTSKCNLKLNGTIEEVVYDLPSLFDLHYLFKSNVMPYTLTVMFRNNKLLAEEMHKMNFAFNGDWALLFLAGYKGLIGYMSDITGVYREGIGIIANTRNVYKLLNGLETNIKLNELTGNRYDYLIGSFEYHYTNITYAYFEEGKKLMGLKWFFKTLGYLVKNQGIGALTKHGTFFKHSIKLFLGFNRS